ncbi:MAG: hypothetical protein AAGD01_01795 [Acidobacteriota bacterium]
MLRQFRLNPSSFTMLASWMVAMVLVFAVACGPSGPSVEEVQAERSAALNEIVDAKAALDAKRQELAELRDTLANPVDEEAAGGEAADGEAAEGGDEAQLSPEDLEVKVNQLASEVEDETQEVVKRIVEFINSDPPTRGEPLSDLQKQAADLKIQEDILVAREWIEKGGDYKRAINILEQALPLDSENESLKQELASAQEWRFVTEERFGGVEKGQTEAEVRKVLGPVNLRNVKEYPERNVTLWLYPKDEAGNAAGVYFRPQRGELKVYQTNFSAVNRDEEPEA